ncbi:MAG: hypothetical protein HC851_02520 [Acaryochloris sp. RU_4_1]|nr:hypothetical protein [Acaryochloris sp. SU_5_25]NJM64607.1 hypothetical protein [Acaryochloris sp. RU_4_1]NJR55704.1 hypothetical protein [Acaryochloris sp. CRU_2_0]
MIILLVGAVGLVIWSLQLMKMAHQSREASLIFAGVLVAVSAMGLVTVYLLMDGCIGYLTGAESLSAQIMTLFKGG